MSATQRHEAEALRVKYARVFGVPVEDVEVELLHDENARVSHRTDASMPVWTTGQGIDDWNAKTGSRFR